MVGLHRRVPQQFFDRIAYPVIPAFVVAGSRERVGGMLAAWWSQLSFKPLLMGVLIAPERFTYRLVSEAGKFSINLIDFKYVDSMPYIGDVSERFLVGKIGKAGLHVEWDGETGIPYIAESRAYILLDLVDRRPYGDHDLFVGRVLGAYADEAFRDGLWDLNVYRPLMYLGRSKRPAKVRRVYVTFDGVLRRELDFAGGGLERYSRRRYAVLNELRRVAKDFQDLEGDVFREKVLEVLKKYGLGEDDLEYYIEELRRGRG